MKVRLCDSCEVRIPYASPLRKYKLRIRYFFCEWRPFDLCENCFRSLRLIIENKK